MGGMRSMHRMHTSPALPPLDLSLLPLLEVLLTEANVTRAARRLEMSQPALSHSLNRARQMFSDPLLVRSGRGLVRTRRADELLPELQRVLEQARALRTGSAHPARLRRSLIIATSDQGQLLLLPPLLERLDREAPEARLDVQPLPEDLEAALDGAVDLVITARAPTSPRLRQSVLGAIPLVWIVRRKHPALRTHLDRKAVAALPKVQVIPTTRLLSLAQSGIGDGGGAQNVRVRVTQFLVAASLVARTDLACAIDVASANALSKYFPLAIVPLASAGKVDVVMHWHEKNDRDPSHAWLRTLIREVAVSGMNQGKRNAPTRSAV
jgi:DNA-binding transcriptional LysR family regulator